MEIRPLQGINNDIICAAFIEAFKGYVRTFSHAELERMFARRAVDLALSFGAFDDRKLVSFTINGSGYFNGKLTAYDSGTGTIEAYRGQGLATKIFEASLPVLKQAGIEQYLLEVLQDNTAAVSVYTKQGFSISREFNYFVQQKSEIRSHNKPLPIGYTIHETGIDTDSMKAMWDFYPSWQNTFDAILRTPDDFKTLGVFHNNMLVGYGMIEPAAGDIPQFAIQQEHRNNGLGTALLQELIKYNRHTVIKFINTDKAYQPFTSFLEKSNIVLSGTQFEMVKQLNL